jgi:hypothetical protein
MRNSLFDLWHYDEATLFDLVLYDYDKATHFDEVTAALEVAASQGSDLAGNPYALSFCTGLDILLKQIGHDYYIGMPGGPPRDFDCPDCGGLNTSLCEF